MKNYNKILEAVNKGIQIALDDYEDDELNGSLSPNKDVINIDNIIKNKIEFNKYYVDLGLPSGTIWCKYNLGVDPNHLRDAKNWIGDYYAWGEIEPNNVYSWRKYKWFESLDNAYNINLNKYIISATGKHNGKNADNISKLEYEDDAAYVQSNGEQIMPSKDQCVELIKNTAIEYIQNYKNIIGLNGYIFRSLKNENEMFIPCAGFKFSSYTSQKNNYLYIWTSSTYQTQMAYCLQDAEQPSHLSINAEGRACGIPIRPIKNTQQEKIENDIEYKVLQYYEKYKKLTIQSQELARLNNKHVVIDDKFLQPILSKRVYNNINSYMSITNNTISYQKFYEIMKKHNLKLLGGKKFGYPEIEFSPTDPR